MCKSFRLSTLAKNCEQWRSNLFARQSNDNENSYIVKKKRPSEEGLFFRN